MFDILVDSARLAARYGRRAYGATQLRSLATEGAAPMAVRDSIRKAIAWPADPSEKAIISQIEAKRAELLSSTKRLAFPDFGAVDPSSIFAGGSLTVNRTLGEMTRSSKPSRWAYLLFRLIRELKPTQGVELGACVGISAAYQAAAMQLNGTGHLISLEGADVLAVRANQTLKELALDNYAEVRAGRFVDTLAPTLKEIGTISWAFIDGHHDGEATLAYTQQILRHCTDDAVLVYDDVNWSTSMKDAWARIVANSSYQLTVDLHAIGIAVLSKPQHRTPQRWNVRYW